MVVTETPAPETTDDTIVATIVTDTARGDNLGGHPSEYKSIVYVEEKSYHKAPGPYKSYEFVDTGKKTGYAMTDGNEVEKLPKVYKVQLMLHFSLQKGTKGADKWISSFQLLSIKPAVISGFERQGFSSATPLFHKVDVRGII